MKITYNENPLKTTVELDEQDKEVFWLKIKVKELESRLVSVYCSLQIDREFDVDRARQASDLVHYVQEDDGVRTTVDKRADRMLEAYTRELTGVHCGDCVCAPCSCLKCRAEDILGINTLGIFPGKHELHQVSGAFGKGRGLTEALEYLKNHKIAKEKPTGWERTTQEDYEKLIPKWEADQARAYEYLKWHKEEHFK